MAEPLTPGKQRSQANLLRGPSKDPAKQARQFANLSPNANRSHGARSQEVVSLAETHKQRLAALFANPDPELLATQSRRSAMLELAERFIDANGLLRRSPKGQPFPVVELWLKLSSAFERTHQVMLDQDRQHGEPPGSALAGIVAELTAGEADDAGD